MIVFRQTDARYPFLWESANQPPARWHGPGEGPAHYFADTPDGAWAEFLRHEEITDPADLATIRRQMWAVDIGDDPVAPVAVGPGIATGGVLSYAACQAEARRLRHQGAKRIKAPSAALAPGAAGGTFVKGGVRPAPPRDGQTLVVFGDPTELVGWVAADAAAPCGDLLPRVRHYGND